MRLEVPPLPMAASAEGLSVRQLFHRMQLAVPLTLLAVLLVVAMFDAPLHEFLGHALAAVGGFMVMSVVSSTYARGGDGYLRYFGYALPWVALFDLSIAFYTARGSASGLIDELHRSAFLLQAGLLAMAPFWIERKVRVWAAVVPWGVVAALLFVTALSAPPLAGHGWIANLGVGMLALAGLVALVMRRGQLDSRLQPLLLASALATLAAFAVWALHTHDPAAESVSHAARLLGLWLLYVAAARSVLPLPSRDEVNYRELFQSTIVGVALTRPDGSFLAANPALASIFGYESPAALLAASPCNVSLPVPTGAARELEARIRRRDGELRWITGNMVALRNRDGGLVGFQASVFDITEARAATERARVEAERLRRLVEVLPVGVWMTDEQGRIVLGNEVGRAIWAGARYVGMQDYGQYKGWWLASGAPIGTDEWPLARALQHGETRLNDEIEIECFDGSRRIIRNSAAPVRDDEGRLFGALVVNEDITELKRRAAALERFQAIVQSSDDAIFETDARGIVLSWNEGARRLFGYDSAAIVGDRVDELIPAASRQAEAEILRDVRSGRAVEHYETTRLRKDGTTVRVSLAVSPVRDAAGRITGVAQIARDITERERAAQAARTAQERFQRVARATSDAVWDWDLAADQVWWNDGYQALFGHPLEGRAPGAASWYEHIHPEDLDRVRSSIRAVIDGAGETWSHEYRFRRADGSYAEVFDRGFVERDGAGQALRMSGAMMDITARKSAERERTKLARMYAALSAVNELVARARSPAELLQGACEIAVASADSEYALVRMIEASGRFAGLTAFAGAADQRARMARSIDTREGSPDGELITAVALRTGRAAFSSQAEIARRFPGTRGQSAGAYPLRRGAALVGVLLLRGRQADAFDGEAGQLLERMAASISLGLTKLESEAALRKQQEELRNLADNSPDGILRLDRELRCTFANAAAQRMSGQGAATLVLRDDWQAAVARALATGEVQSVEFGLASLEGMREYQARFAPERDAAGGVESVLVISRDITDRKRAERAMAESEARLRSIVEATAEPLLLVDPEGIALFANPAAAALFGRSAAELAGMPLGLPLTDARPADVAIVLPDGVVRPAEMRFAATELEGRPVLVVSLHDLSERKRYEAHIEHLANHDALTGLPNRTLLRDRVGQAIAHARRTQGQVALLFVDLDHFKLINDSFGHGIGDAVLLEVGRRLKRMVREGDTVARLGGDEFVLVAPDLAAPGDAARVARKIGDALQASVAFDTRELQVSPSIGISLFPGDGDDFDSLLQCADAAMYRAKEAGRANYQFYSAEMGARARERVETEAGLRQALERGELRLHYQPQVALATGEITGFEALLRWQHPERGMISPGAFIPVAEESGLIVPIGQWALHTACRDAAAWARAGLGSRKVAVNLSARQFWQGSVTEAVRQALAESGLPAAQLEVEITESVVARDLQQVMNALAQLRRMGVDVAIDDFGTGYSSLAYLRSLPIHKLKIDKSFIDGIPLDPEATALASEIIRLAHVLSLQVVAEGVEARAQAVYLRDAGCEAMQGFFFARPMPAEDCAVLLRSRRRLALDAGTEGLE